MNKVVKIEPGWRCCCPYCGEELLNVECVKCTVTFWDWIKNVLSKYALPLLAALSWARWIYYSNKLQQARDKYVIAREERKQLECQLQDIEFREGTLEALKPTKQEIQYQDTEFKQTLIRKKMLCEIKMLHNKIKRNNCEAIKLKAQKSHLLEDLEEAKRVLAAAVNRYKQMNN